jgi:large subunit ribosomal protein L10
MAVSKAQKSEILSVLEAHIREAKSIGFTKNQRLATLDTSRIKKELRDVQAIFMIAKKTLIRIAFKNVHGIDLDMDSLPGQVALIIAKGDAISPLGVISKYVKEFKKEEKIVLIAGYMDGRMMDAAETTKLSTLPSREVLLSRLLGSMMSPLASLARFFDAAGKDMTEKNVKTVKDLVGAAPAANATVPAPVVETPKEDTPTVETPTEVASAPADVSPEVAVVDTPVDTAEKVA